MSQNDKPIFPRSSQLSDEENEKLRQETRQRLENEEKSLETKFSNESSVVCSQCSLPTAPDSQFCLNCGNFLKGASKGFSDVYDPTPIPEPFPNNTPVNPYKAYPLEPTEQPQPPMMMPAYGPPPVFLNGKVNNWGKVLLILGIAFISILGALLMFGFWYYAQLR